MVVENRIVPVNPVNNNLNMNPHDSFQLVRDVLHVPNLTDAQIRERSDLTNLMLHTVQYLLRNKGESDTTRITPYYSSNMDTSTTWTDVFAVEQLNKISMYNENIRAYKERISSIVDSIQVFMDMGHVSKELTVSILKTLRFRDRGTDSEQLVDVLSQIIHNNCDINTVRQIYNLILYSCPYVFTTAMLGDASAVHILNHSPYEYCALVIQDLNMNISVGDINLVMRTQARLEGNLPNVGLYRNMYEILRPVINSGLYVFNNPYRSIGLGLLRSTRPFIPHMIDTLERSLFCVLGAGPAFGVVYRGSSTNIGDISLIVGTSSNNTEVRDRIFLQILGEYT